MVPPPPPPGGPKSGPAGNAKGPAASGKGGAPPAKAPAPCVLPHQGLLHATPPPPAKAPPPPPNPPPAPKDDLDFLPAQPGSLAWDKGVTGEADEGWLRGAGLCGEWDAFLNAEDERVEVGRRGRVGKLAVQRAVKEKEPEPALTMDSSVLGPGFPALGIAESLLRDDEDDLPLVHSLMEPEGENSFTRAGTSASTKDLPGSDCWLVPDPNVDKAQEAHQAESAKLAFLKEELIFTAAHPGEAWRGTEECGGTQVVGRSILEEVFGIKPTTGDPKVEEPAEPEPEAAPSPQESSYVPRKFFPDDSDRKRSSSDASRAQGHSADGDRSRSVGHSWGGENMRGPAAWQGQVQTPQQQMPTYHRGDPHNAVWTPQQAQQQAFETAQAQAGQVMGLLAGMNVGVVAVPMAMVPVATTGHGGSHWGSTFLPVTGGATQLAIPMTAGGHVPTVQSLQVWGSSPPTRLQAGWQQHPQQQMFVQPVHWQPRQQEVAGDWSESQHWSEGGAQGGLTLREAWQAETEGDEDDATMAGTVARTAMGDELSWPQGPGGRRAWPPTELCAQLLQRAGAYCVERILHMLPGRGGVAPAGRIELCARSTGGGAVVRMCVRRFPEERLGDITHREAQRLADVASALQSTAPNTAEAMEAHQTVIAIVEQVHLFAARNRASARRDGSGEAGSRGTGAEPSEEAECSPWVEIAATIALSVLPPERLWGICRPLGVYREEREPKDDRWRQQGLPRPPGDVLAISDYLAGGTLLELAGELQAPGPMREAQVWPIIRSLLAAVRGFHRLGLAHGGIGLESVLRRDSNSQEVLLVGLGRVAAAGPSAMGGQPEDGKLSPYRAPETHRQGIYETCAADLFACGVVAYALATGEYPWASTRPGSCAAFLYAWRHGLHAYFDTRLVQNPSGGPPQHLTQCMSMRFRQFLIALLDFEPPARSAALNFTC